MLPLVKRLPSLAACIVAKLIGPLLRFLRPALEVLKTFRGLLFLFCAFDFVPQLPVEVFVEGSGTDVVSVQNASNISGFGQELGRIMDSF